MRIDRTILTYTIASSIAALSVGYATFPGPPTASSGSGLTSFQAGTTASAAEVNGNFAFLDSKATKNAADIGTNVGNIGKNATSIGSNRSDIDKHTLAIAENKSNVGKNVSDIAKVTGVVTKNGTDIGTNKTNIGKNATDIGKNRVDIGKNTRDISNLRIGQLRTISGVKPNLSGDVRIVGGKNVTVSPLGINNSVRIDANVFDGTFTSDKVPAVALTGTKTGNYNNAGAVNIKAHGQRGLWVEAGKDDKHSGFTTGIFCNMVPAGSSGVGNDNIGIKMLLAPGKHPNIQKANHIGLRATVGSLAAHVDSWGKGVDVKANANHWAYGVQGNAQIRVTSQGKAVGVFGTVHSATNNLAIQASGKFAATGSKNFIHPHPKNPKKVVEFVCLEGNENGTYFRGTARLISGHAKIDIPEEWRHVTAEKGLTVHLTPIKSLARLAVWDMKRDKITVRGDEDCEFSFIVHGKRRGFEKHTAVRDNVDFRPRFFGVPFGTQYKRAYRNLLVENGILNPDYTPNVDTARRVGWKLREPTTEQLQKAAEDEAMWEANQRVMEAAYEAREEQRKRQKAFAPR